ncbi:MAG: hypothetical protein J7577_00980 [Sphingobacteriaceae bacterium]|nr:hypothetical protein [Sphingobacteriaceae bacterium]
MKDLKATTRANRRRYYLKQKLKDVFNVDTRQKQVDIPATAPQLSKQKSKWLNELGERFGYNLQIGVI